MSDKRRAVDKKGTRRSPRIMDNEAASWVSGWSSRSLVTVRREELITPKNRWSARRGYKELHTYPTPQDLVNSAAEMMKTWARSKDPAFLPELEKLLGHVRWEPIFQGVPGTAEYGQCGPFTQGYRMTLWLSPPRPTDVRSAPDTFILPSMGGGETEPTIGRWIGAVCGPSFSQRRDYSPVYR